MLPISRGDRRCREIDEQAHAIDRRDRDHHRKRQPDPIGVPMNQNARHSTMQQVLNQLGNREKEISNMLPQDLPIERFQANVLNALRNTPSILDATAASIVKIGRASCRERVCTCRYRWSPYPYKKKKLK